MGDIFLSFLFLFLSFFFSSLFSSCFSFLSFPPPTLFFPHHLLLPPKIFCPHICKIPHSQPPFSLHAQKPRRFAVSSATPEPTFGALQSCPICLHPLGFSFSLLRLPLQGRFASASTEKFWPIGLGFLPSSVGAGFFFPTVSVFVQAAPVLIPSPSGLLFYFIQCWHHMAAMATEYIQFLTPDLSVKGLHVLVWSENK